MAREPDGIQAEPALPPSLRFLKGLVIVLTLTMIGGVITVVGLLVTRMPQSLGPRPLPALPAAVTLPAGARAQAVTFGQGWVGVVVTDGAAQRFLVYNPDGKALGTMDLPAAP